MKTGVTVTEKNISRIKKQTHKQKVRRAEPWFKFCQKITPSIERVVTVCVCGFSSINEIIFHTYV